MKLTEILIVESIESAKAEVARQSKKWQEINSTLEKKMKGNFVPLPTNKYRFGYPSMVAQTGERPVALAKIGDIHMPFYISTGLGGKEKVPTGKWYPFFGISDSGWINKGSQQDMLNYYGSSELKNVAEWLNNNVGNLLALDREDPILPAFDNIKTIQLINQDLSPTDRPSHKDVFGKPLPNEVFNKLNKQFEDNVNNTLIRIGSQPYYNKNDKSSNTSSTTKQQTTTPQVIQQQGSEIVGSLELIDSETNRKITTLRLSTDVNGTLMDRWGYSDSVRFYSNPQYWLIKDSNNKWIIRPYTNAINVTNINGIPIIKDTSLKQGMVISIGKSKKNPITVKQGA